MATTTTNLALTKPTGTEQYDVNIFNNNADAIDAPFGAAGGHKHTGVAGDGPQIAAGGIEALAVTTAKLADQAVTGDKLAPGALAGAQFHNLLKNGDFESWSAGTSSAPDGWVANANATVAKVTSGQKRGVAAARYTLTADEGDTHLDAVVSTEPWFAYLKGRTVTLGGWVKSSAAGKARFSITDGAAQVYSSYHTGGGGWEWLTVTRAIDAAATVLQFRMWAGTVNGDTADFDGAIAVEGGFAPAFYPHPNDEHLRISVYQDTTPANNIDRGVWRAELGKVSIAGNTGLTYVSKAITFETAFRTIYGVLITGADEKVGGSDVSWETESHATSGFTAKAHTLNTGVNFANTSSGTATWLAIGAV